MKLKRIMVCSLAVALLALMIMPGQACELYTDLWAGSDHTDVGDIEVYRNGNLWITFATTDGWYLVETHLVVATSFEDIPQTKSGNPKIGHFPYAAVHDPGVTEYTYVLPFIDGELYIAAHAVVAKDGVGQETAWGQGPTHQEFPGNSWALYFTFPFSPP